MGKSLTWIRCTQPFLTALSRPSRIIRVTLLTGTLKRMATSSVVSHSANGSLSASAVRPKRKNPLRGVNRYPIMGTIGCQYGYCGQDDVCASRLYDDDMTR